MESIGGHSGIGHSGHSGIGHNGHSGRGGVWGIKDRKALTDESILTVTEHNIRAREAGFKFGK